VSARAVPQRQGRALRASSMSPMPPHSGAESRVRRLAEHLQAQRASPATAAPNRRRRDRRDRDRDPAAAAAAAAVAAQPLSFGTGSAGDLDAIKRSFEENGFCVIQGVLGEDVRGSVQQELEALVRSPHDSHQQLELLALAIARSLAPLRASLTANEQNRGYELVLTLRGWAACGRWRALPWPHTAPPGPRSRPMHPSPTACSPSSTTASSSRQRASGPSFIALAASTSSFIRPFSTLSRTSSAAVRYGCIRTTPRAQRFQGDRRTRSAGTKTPATQCHRILLVAIYAGDCIHLDGSSTQ
jgi:hypothetical protein